MRAACLIVLVALSLQVSSMSIFTKGKISECCETMNHRLISENIKRYIRTDDNACKRKAFIVELKNGMKICANATAENVLSAVKKFDKKKAKKSKQVTQQ